MWGGVVCGEFLARDSQGESFDEDEATDVGLEGDLDSGGIFAHGPPSSVDEFFAEGIANGLLVGFAIDGGFFGGGEGDDLRGRDLPADGVEFGEFFGAFRFFVVGDDDLGRREGRGDGDGGKGQGDGEKQGADHESGRLRVKPSCASETFGGRLAWVSSHLSSCERWVR